MTNTPSPAPKPLGPVGRALGTVKLIAAMLAAAVMRKNMP